MDWKVAGRSSRRHFANNQDLCKGATTSTGVCRSTLSNIFDPKSGNTVMFAFDHGYFMVQTFAGLERLDLLLPQLLLLTLTGL